MKLFLLPLLAGCVGAPDYYEVTPMYGVSEFASPVREFDTMGVMFTIGWAPGQSSHNDRMEDYALASLAANPNVSPEWLQDAMDEAADDEGEMAEDIELSDFTEKPETLNEATIYFIWIVGLCLLMFTLKQVGILDRFLPGKKNPKDEES